ncbi:hypothetical protein Scep_027991 [Stephania cephalantha]|uniref:UDP-N-acetylglucosamine 1-carboxyvinyltransferase n=1 Tax=Stephania cephalantha TaxID=152367 RepID=A0AAP0E924_9MAGN
MASIPNPSIHLSQSPKPTFISPKLHNTTIKPPNSDQKVVIHGGLKLSGHVEISGSKNSALAVLAGTLCCSGASKLRNVPDISDVRTMVSILRSLGVRVDTCGGEVVVDADGILSVDPCCEEVRKMRAGFFCSRPLIARIGEAVVALPGGCDIGTRPVDLFFNGLRALGAVVELRIRRAVAVACVPDFGWASHIESVDKLYD